MLRSHAKIENKSETGLAYVAILLLVAIMSTMGLSFLYKATTLTKATLNRVAGMQAEYLAEAAASHAKWRLFNESDFPAAEDKYYMHSLAGGRYGYKVRRHTVNTFATIATVGVVGENVVQQSHVLYILPNNSIDILFVVINPHSLTSQEEQRKTLMESWGFVVNLIDEASSQAVYDTALATVDVVYVSEEISSSNVNTKLTNVSIGVVNEEIELTDEIGFISGNKIWRSRDQIEIVDNTHYITSPFNMGWLTFLNSIQDLAMFNSPYAPGMEVLAETLDFGSTTKPSLATLEVGAELYGSGTAAGRRVHLPWGASAFDFAVLNDDGKTIMRRAIEWAADPDAGLIAHWKFDETSGATTAADSSGNGYDATLTNMDPATDWVEGNIVGALDFDGFNDYAITTVDLDPPPIGTVAFWMQVPGLPASHGRIFGISGQWEVRHVTTGTPEGIPYGLVFDLHVVADNTEFTTDSTFGTAGQWYHIAAVFNANDDSFQIYVDGTLEKSGSRTLEIYPPDKLSIGTRTGSTQYWVGTLDDLRVYNRQLRAADITRLYEIGN